MKKRKQKTILKESKKAIKQDLKLAITTALQKIAENSGPISKKTNKIIEKTANQAAKKLAKSIKVGIVEEIVPIAAS